MAKQVINLGNAANDGTGDTLRTGAYKINQNFDELYYAVSSSVLSVSAGEGISVSNNNLGQIVVTNTLPNRFSINRIEIPDNYAIIADSLTTTINFEAGDNISLTTNPVTKTITISANSTYTGDITGNLISLATGDTVVSTATPIAELYGNLTGDVVGKLNSITYPTAHGSLGQVLITDGAGATAWSTISSIPSIGNFRFSINTLSTNTLGENIILSPRGTGIVNVVSKLQVSNTTESTSTTTGSLIISGGVGVAKTVTANEFVGDGSGITNLDAANISTGSVDLSRLGIGIADSTTYLRGDGTWSQVSSTGNGTGTQGRQGIQGIQGFGIQGIQGRFGIQGVQGTDGLLGIQGRTGTQGTTGIGLTGTQGLQGSYGLQGYLGIQGTTGAGLQGSQGIQGKDGVQGYVGVPGDSIQGIQGPQSAQGIQGRQGPQGIQGAQGLQGRQGAGAQGLQGTTGAGPQGSQGIQGIQGISIQGLQGILGGHVMISDDTSSNTSYYLSMASITTGAWESAYVSSTKLSFNPSTGTLTTIDLNTTSDMRLKTNIDKIVDPLAIIQQISGYKFNWLDSGKLSYGVMAQELELILPELVTEQETGYKTVNYLPLIAFLIEAIKSQQIQINNLK